MVCYDTMQQFLTINTLQRTDNKVYH